jgi:hypothetical protein
MRRSGAITTARRLDVVLARYLCHHGSDRSPNLAQSSTGEDDHRSCPGLAPDPLVDPGCRRQSVHDSGGDVAAEALAVGAEQDGPCSRSLMARSIALAVRGRGARGASDLLAAFAHDPPDAVTAFDVELLDVGARFGDPPPSIRTWVESGRGRLGQV